MATATKVKEVKAKELADQLIIICGGRSTDATTELPKQVAGHDATYKWKDIAAVGEYEASNAEGEKVDLNLTPEDINTYATTGNSMIKAGVEIPVNTDHSDSAKDTIGWIKEFKVDADKLMGLFQFIGEDADLMAARNRVSAGFNTGDYIDGTGKHWGPAIWHVALTPLPAIPDQDPFRDMALKFASKVICMDIAAPDQLSDIPPDEPLSEGIGSDNKESIDMPTLKCSQETLDRLHSLVPGLKDAADDDKLACMAQHIHTQSMNDAQDAGYDNTDGVNMSLVMAKASENRAKWKKNQLPELSADSQEALVENVSTKLDMALSKGAIDPNTKKKLSTILGKDEKGNLNIFAYSKNGGNRALALSLVDAMIDNKPLEMKEISGAQILTKDNVNPVSKEIIESMYKTVGLKK